MSPTGGQASSWEATGSHQRGRVGGTEEALQTHPPDSEPQAWGGPRPVGPGAQAAGAPPHPRPSGPSLGQLSSMRQGGRGVGGRPLGRMRGQDGPGQRRRQQGGRGAPCSPRSCAQSTLPTLLVQQVRKDRDKQTCFSLVSSALKSKTVLEATAIPPKGHKEGKLFPATAIRTRSRQVSDVAEDPSPGALSTSVRRAAGQRPPERLSGAGLGAARGAALKGRFILDLGSARPVPAPACVAGRRGQETGPRRPAGGGGPLRTHWLTTGD